MFLFSEFSEAASNLKSNNPTLKGGEKTNTRILGRGFGKHRSSREEREQETGMK